jgi:putative FmdB family regulatory protein
MPSYDYQCEKCKTIIEVTHSILDDPHTTCDCPKCKKEMPCHRIISRNYAGIQFKGDGWTPKNSGFGKRGYKGKFQNLVREKGTPVDAPNRKAEADRQFQQWVDTGGLQGIKPSFTTNSEITDWRAKPMESDERISKGKKNN